VEHASATDVAEDRLAGRDELRQEVA